MTFEDFRRWALDSSLGAARRWEEPLDDEIKVVLAADDYDAYHVIPMPPIYLQRERGYVHWLAGALPEIVANRSLRRLAFRSSVWVSNDPMYADRPVDDPKRRELLAIQVAEKGRYEAWHAPIRRSSAGLPSVGDWEIHATDKDGLSGALPNRIRKALDDRGASRGPTMPAAEMVLGSWDVPDGFFPLAANCGPLDYAREGTTSTYMALFRPESPGPVIVSQAIVFPEADGPLGHIEGALQALAQMQNSEFTGPPLGDKTNYVEGKLDGGRLYRYQALWRYPGVFCEVAVSGPPGRFSKSDLYHFAAVQNRRATAELDSRREATG